MPSLKVRDLQRMEEIGLPEQERPAPHRWALDRKPRRAVRVYLAQSGHGAERETSPFL